MCELFILSQIQLFLEKSNDPNQLPYKKARSTLDAVGLLVHTIAKSLDGGSKVNKAIFEDFSSALNIIPRSLILDRLSSPGPPTWIVLWLLFCFTNRRQRICQNGRCSSYVFNNVGVLQGAVLSFFSIFLAYWLPYVSSQKTAEVCEWFCTW